MTLVQHGTIVPLATPAALDYCHGKTIDAVISLIVPTYLS
jgi:hypothetical protein